MGTQSRPMCLTDDDIHVLLAGDGRRIAVRLRVWREEGRRPFVLAEAAGAAPIRDDAPRIMTYVHHCLMKGSECVYLEHDGPTWHAVTFAWLRHAATSPYRKPITRRDLEAVLGAAIVD